jgi:hypothetical protein
VMEFLEGERGELRGSTGVFLLHRGWRGDRFELEVAASGHMGVHTACSAIIIIVECFPDFTLGLASLVVAPLLDIPIAGTFRASGLADDECDYDEEETYRSNYCSYHCSNWDGWWETRRRAFRRELGEACVCGGWLGGRPTARSGWGEVNGWSWGSYGARDEWHVYRG